MCTSQAETQVVDLVDVEDDHPMDWDCLCPECEHARQLRYEQTDWSELCEIEEMALESYCYRYFEQSHPECLTVMEQSNWSLSWFDAGLLTRYPGVIPPCGSLCFCSRCAEAKDCAGDDQDYDAWCRAFPTLFQGEQS